jgi:hypothetical protein
VLRPALFEVEDRVSGVERCLKLWRKTGTPARFLKTRGIECLVIDPGSLQVSRRGRRVKTDRVDVKTLLRTLIAWCRGERHVWSLVRIPSIDEEDLRRSHRERSRLVRERTAHINRIKGPRHKHVEPRSRYRREFVAWPEQVSFFLDWQPFGLQLRAGLRGAPPGLRRQVRGLELGNVALQNASPTKSLGCQNVLEKQGVRPRFQKTDISEFESSHPATQSGLREQKYEMVLRRRWTRRRRDLRPTATGCVSNILTRFYLEHVAVDFLDMPIILAHPSFAWQ